jgi:murein DD-endopeptidase MepM/ murein hydrolase activator NlpD
MDSLTYNATTRDWRTHNGVDIAAEEGAEVRSAADGTVYTVYEDDTMGMTVVIRHEDGYVTTYSSLGETVTVAPGDSVKAGQKIGCADTSALLESAIGCHVHFGVTRDNVPVDPAEFLSQE